MDAANLGPNLDTEPTHIYLISNSKMYVNVLVRASTENRARVLAAQSSWGNEDYLDKVITKCHRLDGIPGEIVFGGNIHEQITFHPVGGDSLHSQLIVKRQLK